MVLKKIIFYVFSTRTPIRATIHTLGGEVIYDKILATNQSKICVCCCENKIAINLNYNMQNQTQYYVLTDHKCQFFNVYFNINEQLTTQQTIFLLDKNYDLPINSAILTFK